MKALLAGPVIARLCPDGLTLAQVGSLIGVSRERVRQIQEKGLEKLLRDSAARELLEAIAERGRVW